MVNHGQHVDKQVHKLFKTFILFYRYLRYGNNAASVDCIIACE